VSLQNHKLILQPDKTPMPWQEAEELAKTGFWEFQVKSGKFSCTSNTLRLVNPRLQPEEINFNALIAHFHEADKANLTENWDLLLGQARELDYNARITDLFGDKWIKIKAKAIWENSTVVKIIGYFQDITEAKVLEQLLYAARETAEQEMKAKSDFLSVITHEIRTPLNSISGFTYLLLQEDVNREEQKEYLRSIQFSTQNLLSLINETLDYSKIEAGKLEFEHIPFQFHELLEDIHRSFYLRAAEKKVNLYLDISPATPDVAVGDPAKLCQILNNLISNAIKFTHEGHIKVSVEVVYESETDWVLEVAVSDTGVGIAEDKQPLIFESFTQANASTNRQFGGTGLGLAITKKLIELQHGSIKLHSTPGEGSEFIVRLKLAKPEANHIGMPRPEVNLNLNQYAGLQGAKILVVDDNALNRNVASKLLTNWQVKVDTAENGLEALKKVKTSPYDIILMDLFMPVMDGFQAITQIKGYGIKTPIIALTGSALTEEENKMMDLGVHDYVTKPFNPQELYKTILEHLILVEI
jgi:signal transduction histidine kinase